MATCIDCGLPKNSTYRRCRACRRRDYRVRAIECLGGKCVRCGITYPLNFDHVNDDGCLEPRLPGKRGVSPNTKEKMWRDIINGERSRYQLLCPNCNYLKTFDPEIFAEPPAWRPVDD